MILISIADQMLYHRRKTGVWYEYPVSTAANGAGNERGSYKTPLGKHRIYQKIGADLPEGTAFKAREPIGIYNPLNDDPTRDWILTRILWLEGCETSINRRGKVDTKSRYIYIHGTHEEEKLGTPCSHGCIRMQADDLLELFFYADEGESVVIREE